MNEYTTRSTDLDNFLNDIKNREFYGNINLELSCFGGKILIKSYNINEMSFKEPPKKKVKKDEIEELFVL